MMRVLSSQSRGWLCAAGVMLGLGIASSGLAATKVVPLTEDEQTWLTMMREEEKVARDLYLAFYDLWSFRSFKNTARSEQTHMNTLARLLKRYAVEDPVADNEAGVFTNPDLQALYDTLLAQGSLSLGDAIQVGMLVEAADIEDLAAATAATTHRDVLTVYKSLARGSSSHLKAFQKSSSKYAPTGSCTGTCSDTGTCTGSGSCSGTGTCSGSGSCSDTGTCTGSGSCTGTGTCTGSGSCSDTGTCTGSGSCSGTGTGSCSGSGSCGGK